MVDEIPVPTWYTHGIRYCIQKTNILFALQPYSVQPYASVVLYIKNRMKIMNSYLELLV